MASSKKTNFLDEAKASENVCEKKQKNHNPFDLEFCKLWEIVQRTWSLPPRKYILTKFEDVAMVHHLESARHLTVRKALNEQPTLTLNRQNAMCLLSRSNNDQKWKKRRATVQLYPNPSS